MTTIQQEEEEEAEKEKETGASFTYDVCISSGLKKTNKKKNPRSFKAILMA